MRCAHRLGGEDGDLVRGNFVLLADACEAGEGLGDECDCGLRELKFHPPWLAGVESVVEGDACAFAVYGGEETGARRGEVGDGEADAVTG